MRDCGEFAYSMLNTYEALDSCLSMSTVVNSVQEAESKDTNTCIGYFRHKEHLVFNRSMAILQTFLKVAL